MRMRWFYILLLYASVQAEFGRSYLGNSRLCHEWYCLNQKLGFGESLPDKGLASHAFKGLLPDGPWQGAVEKALDVCYGDRPRRYTNTCPGQALMHCVVDQLVQNCPEDSVRINDGCTTVTSLAGFKYMFSQSRYMNLEQNMLRGERRPSWFMKNYFNLKCCNLPELFSSSVLSECGFKAMMQYYDHQPHYNTSTVRPLIYPARPLSNKENQLKIVDLNHFESTTIQPTISNNDGKEKVDLEDDALPEDPMECCDVSPFIQPSSREKCDFHLHWNGETRLSFKEELPPTTSTASPVKRRDIVVVPQPCNITTCVFKKLNVINEAGTVDTDAFMKVLDNYTKTYPFVNKARARAVTKCLKRTIIDYEADCEINKILSCILDVFSENCPHDNEKKDFCKHSKGDLFCQINSSKYRPKNRRTPCFPPSMVDAEVLRQCNTFGLSHVEPATNAPVLNEPKKQIWTLHNKCKDLTPSTMCLMREMGILNKYGFMDYFITKDRLMKFAFDHPEWRALHTMYTNVFTNGPLYTEHCNSPRKFLNVLDSMLLTCPLSKRKDTPQCTRFFKEMTNTAPMSFKNVNEVKFNHIMNHFNHIFAPITPKTTLFQIKKVKIVKNPMYNYGILGSNSEPKVKTVTVKPPTLRPFKKPLVLLPVYLRSGGSSFSHRQLLNNSVHRSPFWIHKQIAAAHNARKMTTTTKPSISTTLRSVFSSNAFDGSELDRRNIM